MLTVRPESLETMQRGRMAEADRLLVEYAEKRFPSVFTPQNSGRTLKLVEQMDQDSKQAKASDPAAPANVSLAAAPKGKE